MPCFRDDQCRPVELITLYTRVLLCIVRNKMQNVAIRKHDAMELWCFFFFSLWAWGSIRTDSSRRKPIHLNYNICYDIQINHKNNTWTLGRKEPESIWKSQNRFKRLVVYFMLVVENIRALHTQIYVFAKKKK